MSRMLGQLARACLSSDGLRHLRLYHTIEGAWRKARNRTTLLYVISAQVECILSVVVLTPGKRMLCLIQPAICAPIEEGVRCSRTCCVAC